MEETKLVEIAHQNGNIYRVYLTDYEINRANTDAEFASELSEKYNKLHAEGLVTSVENSSNPETTFSEHEDPIVEDAQKQEKFRWSNDQTKFLIQKYIEYFGQNKKCDRKKTSKSLYIKISEECIQKDISVNWEQVESKIKGLLKTYKNIRDNNKSSGRARINWPYFDLLDEFIGHRPEVEPLSIVSSHRSNQEIIEIPETIATQEVEPKEEPLEVLRNGDKNKKRRVKAAAVEEPPWFKKFRGDMEIRHTERMTILRDLTNAVKKLAQDEAE